MIASPAPTATITLAQSMDRVAVIVNGDVIGSVKDGGHIVRNADRMLTLNGFRRLSGYSLNADRQLTATGYAA